MLLKLKDLKSKKIVVFGTGISNISLMKYLDFNNVDYTVVGNDVSFPKLIKQDSAKDILQSCDVIFLSPGIDKNIDILKNYNDKITNEIELAFQNTNLPIFSITGTNGKTTCVTMLGKLLEEIGYVPFVGGNIGRPFCDILLDKKKYDCIVLELSSFQLESLFTFKSLAAAILNISFHHGERYKSLDDYAKAKSHIFDRCDFKIQNLDVNNNLDYSRMKLRGEHNKINFSYVYALATKFTNSLSVDFMNKFIQSFKGVEHRLEYVSEGFYNDAKSTNIDSTIKALESFDKPVNLIMGGKLRGRGDSISLHINFLRSKVKRLILIGESAKLLSEEIDFDHEVYNSLDDINFSTFEGDVLYSPAYPSFDQYNNYKERGEHFKRLVK